MRLTLHFLLAHWRDRGIGMDGFARVFGAWLLLAGAVGLTACSNGVSGLVTGTTAVSAADAPGGITNESPMARPIGVAMTSARAKRCGFYFDAGKLRASYLAYEARQTTREQLGSFEKSYDSTFKVISERISGEPDYCTDQKGTEIKADLTRHLQGDFTPNFPKAKVVESCGFFGCNPYANPDEKLDVKKFWDSQAKKK
jgi:hypothetical protein